MRLEGHAENLSAVAWSPDGTKLASGSADGEVRIWDAATGDLRWRLPGHQSPVNALAWSPNSARLASASGQPFGTSRDNTIRIWDMAAGAELLVLAGHSRPVMDVAWSPDGTQLASASQDGSARIWRIWQTLDALRTHAEQCCAVRELTAVERKQFGLP
jgi:WD40 repeat protein